jgi:recombination protein RecR
VASFLPKPVQKLIDEFSRLPGIGPKSAQRLAMHLLHSPDTRVREFSDAVSGLKHNVQFCSRCWNIAEGELCRICADSFRDQRQICVVEEILDVVALERTGEYKGTYHVLHGALSPVDGIGPEQLKVYALVERVQGLTLTEGTTETPVELRAAEVQGRGLVEGIEVILATNPGLEGETTALYLLKLLRPFNIKITRIARGLPVGGDLDYADEMTLSRAMQGRGEFF